MVHWIHAPILGGINIGSSPKPGVTFMPTEGDTNPDEIINKSGETKLRGAALNGPDQNDAVDRPASDPDNSLYLDGEENTLYEDAW
jgi:hypothetical protein